MCWYTCHLRLPTFMDLNEHLFMLISSTTNIFQKVGISGISRTVKYLALCQILTPLIESSPDFLTIISPVKNLNYLSPYIYIGLNLVKSGVNCELLFHDVGVS